MYTILLFESISKKLSNFLLMYDANADCGLTKGASTDVFEVTDAQEVFETRLDKRPRSGILMFFLTPNIFWNKKKIEKK